MMTATNVAAIATMISFKVNGSCIGTSFGESRHKNTAINRRNQIKTTKSAIFIRPNRTQYDEIVHFPYIKRHYRFLFDSNSRMN